MSALSSKEKAELRGQAQTIKPAVHIGRNGIQSGTAAELQAAFSQRELIKVAFNATREEIPALVAEVERVTSSECVGGVGKRRSFYRALPEPTPNPWGR